MACFVRRNVIAMMCMSFPSGRLRTSAFFQGCPSLLPWQLTVVSSPAGSLGEDTQCPHRCIMSERETSAALSHWDLELFVTTT